MKKPSTTVILIGAGAVLVGVYLYRKHKAAQSNSAPAAAPVQEVKAALDQIKMPIAEDQKQIQLPGTLLEPTIPNSGIMPPSQAVASKPVPTVAPAPAPSVVKAQPTKLQTVVASNTGVRSATLVAQKAASRNFRGTLAGVGNAYALN